MKKILPLKNDFGATRLPSLLPRIMPRATMQVHTLPPAQLDFQGCEVACAYCKLNMNAMSCFLDSFLLEKMGELPLKNDDVLRCRPAGRVALGRRDLLYYYTIIL